MAAIAAVPLYKDKIMMFYDASALLGLNQANVKLSASAANLWLEKLEKSQAIALEAARNYAATAQKAATAVATNRDLSALFPMQAELMYEPIAQLTHFWRSVMSELQNQESTAAEGFRAAAREWQGSCVDSVDSLANHPWVAHTYKPWADAASLAWGPLATLTRQMFHGAPQHAAPATKHSSEADGARTAGRPRA